MKKNIKIHFVILGSMVLPILLIIILNPVLPIHGNSNGISSHPKMEYALHELIQISAVHGLTKARRFAESRGIELINNQVRVIVATMPSHQIFMTNMRAEAAGLISRYAAVDELEQVTTRFTRDEYITQAKRL